MTVFCTPFEPLFGSKGIMVGGVLDFQNPKIKVVSVKEKDFVNA